MSFDVTDAQDLVQTTEVDYKARRNRLIALVNESHALKDGEIVLFAPCDDPCQSFVQDSSFYYFSGLEEPASVMTLSNDSHDYYLPNYSDSRSKWVYSSTVVTEKKVQDIGFDRLLKTGDLISDIHVYPYFNQEYYKNVIALLSDLIAKNKKIFTCYPSNSSSSVRVRQIIDRLSLFVPHLKESIVDISSEIAQLRRTKDMAEIETLYRAIEVTSAAFQTAAHMLKNGVNESEIQASLEYVFTENNCTPAYPSIVGGGFRGTILHYSQNCHDLEDGQLVVIDAGARYNYYCSDITRTYPVSGKFTDEQKKLYEVVLETQEYIASQAKPGVWLSNPQKKDASLHHMAVEFLKKHGYEKYFIHGIGHFLGVDTHDVGDMRRPLQEGDVITIEPGIYLPDRQIGIRIEDNYWIVEGGNVCLSEEIPKDINSVESLVQQSFDVDLS